MEVDDRAVHSIYKSLVNSGLAFGAKRWVASLDRQCERLASALASSIPAGDVGGNQSTHTTNTFTLKLLLLIFPMTYETWVLIKNLIYLKVEGRLMLISSAFLQFYSKGIKLKNLSFVECLISGAGTLAGYELILLLKEVAFKKRELG